MFILPDVDLMFFITFITSCNTSSIEIWFVLAAGLAENLTQVVFRQPFMIQHVRTRFLSCETWNFLFFCIFSSPYNQPVIFDVIVFLLAAFVLFRELSPKNAWLNHTIHWLVKYANRIFSGVRFHSCVANRIRTGSGFLHCVSGLESDSKKLIPNTSAAQ